MSGEPPGLDALAIEETLDWIESNLAGTPSAEQLRAIRIILDDATFVPVLKEALKRIRTRTAEGRSRAKARGKHMGRPPSLTPAQQNEASRRRAQGATLQELADSYDSSISTMRRATRAA